jgi:hypothetical protein
MEQMSRYVKPRPKPTKHPALQARNVRQADPQLSSRPKPAMDLVEYSHRIMEVLERMCDGDEVERTCGEMGFLRHAYEDPALRHPKALTSYASRGLPWLYAPRVPSQASHLGKKSTSTTSDIEELVGTRRPGWCVADVSESKDMRKTYRRSQDATHRTPGRIAS